jgi:hypothetical protein
MMKMELLKEDKRHAFQAAAPQEPYHVFVRPTAENFLTYPGFFGFERKNNTLA